MVGTVAVPFSPELFDKECRVIWQIINQLFILLYNKIFWFSKLISTIKSFIIKLTSFIKWNMIFFVSLRFWYCESITGFVYYVDNEYIVNNERTISRYHYDIQTDNRRRAQITIIVVRASSITFVQRRCAGLMEVHYIRAFNIDQEIPD